MARSLGSAAFALDATFKSEQVKAAAEKVNRQVAEALKNPNIKVGLDTAKLDAQVKATAVKLRTLDENAKVSPELKTAKIDSELAAFKVKTQAIMKEAGSSSGESFNNGVSDGGGGAGGLMNPAVIAPLIVAGLAAAPGLFAIAGAAGAVALGAAFALKGSPVLQAQAKGLISGLSTTMEGAASVLDKPLSVAFDVLQGQLPVIGGLFRTTFGDVAPLILPITNMLTDLVENIMPGFNSLMKSAQGPLSAFFNTAGKIVGTGLGAFLKNLGPGVAPSLSVITSLLTILSDLLPVIGSVSSIAAEALAPAMRLSADGAGKLVSVIGFVGDGLKKIGQFTAPAVAELAKLGGAQGQAATSGGAMNTALKDATKRLASQLPVIGPVIGSVLKFRDSQDQATKSQRSVTDAVAAHNDALIKLNPQLQQSASLSTTAGAAMDLVTGQVDAQVKAVDKVTGEWQRFFGLMGSSQSALSTVASDITSASGALKKFGEGSLQSNAAIGQLISDNETLVSGLKSQAAEAGNSTGAISAMKAAFIDTARSELDTASHSSTLRNALVLQAQQAGINVTSWGQLKGILEKGKGGLDAASQAVNALSGAQESGRVKAAAMQLAFSKATSAIVKDFASQNLNAVKAKGALDNYTAAIKANGVNSSQAHKARTNLVNDMIASGVNSGKANADVGAYTRAITTNGIGSDQARKARLRLINDILSASSNSTQGKKDLDLFTSAVEHHSSKSDQVRSARARLIQDLVNTGLDSKTATGLVNGLQGSIDRLHGKTVPVMVDVGAAGTITATAAGALSKAAGLSGTSVSNLAAQLVFGMGHAAGGLIGGTGNRDTVPALLTPGEVVVPKNMVARGAVDHLRGKLPGFANGGRVAGATALLRDESLAGAIDAHWSAGIGVEFGTMIRAAFASKIAAAAKAAAKAAAAAAGSPVAYSRIAGVTQWEPDVSRVLSMLGLPQADLPTVMSQMLTESGGNPNAINLTDSNARAGTPSKGLMQVIAGTFAAYRNPSLSGNIYDPLANIYAGINYAIHRYGNPGWLSVLGHGHGYAAGGLVKAITNSGVFDQGGILAPGANLVYNATGKPEHVTPATNNGSQNITLEFAAGDSDFEQFMVTAMRRWIRVRGGNVQTAIGRN